MTGAPQTNPPASAEIEALNDAIDAVDGQLMHLESPLAIVLRAAKAHLVALSASPPAPAVAQDGGNAPSKEWQCATYLAGELAGVTMERARAEADANRLAEAARQISKDIYISDYDIPQDRSLLVKARQLQALLDALAEHDKAHP